MARRQLKHGEMNGHLNDDPEAAAEAWRDEWRHFDPRWRGMVNHTRGGGGGLGLRCIDPIHVLLVTALVIVNIRARRFALSV